MFHGILGSAHRYHPCADSGGRRRTHTVLRSVCHQPTAFFTLRTHHAATQELQRRRTTQLTGKPAGTWTDHRGRWCAVSRGHPGRPNPPSPWVTLGQLSAAPWELPSTVGCGIAWTRTHDVQAIERILHSSECFYWMRHSGAPRSSFLTVVEMRGDSSTDIVTFSCLGSSTQGDGVEL